MATRRSPTRRRRSTTSSRRRSRSSRSAASSPSSTRSSSTPTSTFRRRSRFVGIQERGDCGGAGPACLHRPASFALTSSTKIARTFGVGLTFYPGDFVSLGVEYRALPFSWNRSGFDSRGAGPERQLPRRQGQLAGRHVQVQPDGHAVGRLLVPDEAEDQRVDGDSEERSRPDGRLRTRGLPLHDAARAVEREAGGKRLAHRARARPPGRASRAPRAPRRSACAPGRSPRRPSRCASAGTRRGVVLREQRRRGVEARRLVHVLEEALDLFANAAGACAPRARRGSAPSGRRTWRTRCPTATASAGAPRRTRPRRRAPS